VGKMMTTVRKGSGKPEDWRSCRRYQLKQVDLLTRRGGATSGAGG